MKLKILIADDDERLRSLICDILEKQGYETLSANDGEEALELYENNPDISLLILDVMMPNLNGFEVISEIRDSSDVAILMLTAFGDEENEINGLQKGANDYIAKPFSYPIFIARVESLLRKIKKEKSSNILIGDLQIQRGAHKVFVKKEEILLNNKEYQLLDFLVSNSGVVLSRAKILDTIWGFDYDGDDKTINTHIKMLRSKLGVCSEYIVTKKGTGYVFESPTNGGI